jgi:hypothetical protein
MSHEPPIPQAARSPYPPHPAPMASHDTGAGSEAAAADRGAAGAGGEQSETAGRSWGGRARDTFDRATESKAALGAAVGIGSAALLAAVLFARRGRKERA